MRQVAFNLAVRKDGLINYSQQAGMSRVIDQYPINDGRLVEYRMHLLNNSMKIL